MKVRWTADAKQDRADIVDYIAIENPRAALKMDELFGEAADTLSEFPKLGRMGKIPGTRELIPHEGEAFSFERVGRVMGLRGIDDLTTKHFLPNSAKGDRYLAVDQARGKHKATMGEYVALRAEQVCFYGVGDPEAVKTLIDDHILSIGKRAGTGAGEILESHYELLGQLPRPKGRGL